MRFEVMVRHIWLLAVLLCPLISHAQAGFPTCNRASEGSLYVQNSVTDVKANCTGTDCAGKSYSVPYIKYHTEGQYVWQCLEDQIRGKFAWWSYCSRIHTTAHACKPQLTACAHCDGKPNRYQTKPVIIVTGDTWQDTCKGKKGLSLQSMLDNGKSDLEQQVAQQQREQNSQTTLTLQKVQPLEACTADPVESAN